MVVGVRHKHLRLPLIGTQSRRGGGFWGVGYRGAGYKGACRWTAGYRGIGYRGIGYRGVRTEGYWIQGCWVQKWTVGERECDGGVWVTYRLLPGWLTQPYSCNLPVTSWMVDRTLLL